MEGYASRTPFHIIRKKRMRNKSNETEKGGAIDLFEVMLVSVIVFALMLLYFNYARGVRMKMAIDLAAKNALYQMEETGEWTNEIDRNFKKELAENNVHLVQSAGSAVNTASKDNQDITLVNKSSGKGGTKSALYGEQVTMDVTIYFYSPMTNVFGSVWHGMMPETRRPVTYHIVRSTTCRR